MRREARQIVRRWIGAEGGNAATIFALCLLVIATMVGGALDLSRAESTRVQLREDLDTMLLRVALDGASGFTEKAKADPVIANGTGGAASASASFWTQPVSGGTEFHGQVRAEVPTTLLSLASIETIPVVVHSAVLLPGGTPCITLVDPSASHARRVNSGATISALGCTVQVMSTAAEGAVFNSGTTLDFQHICMRGPGALINGSPPSNLAFNCETVAPVNQAGLPHPSPAACDHDNLVIPSSDVVLDPGVYCGFTNFNGAPNVTLNPGLYVIRGGGWNVNGGTFSGAGVTFYYPDSSKIQFNSAVEADVSAPTSGPYKDIVMFEAAGLSKSDFILNDSPTFRFDGAFYLPSRNATFNSGSKQVNRRVSLVFNTLILNSTVWDLSAAGSDGSKTGSGSNPRLVR